MLYLTSRGRHALAQEGKAIRSRIESLGTPKVWGAIPVDMLNDVQSWQQKCDKARVSSAAVFSALGNDTQHISGAEVLLLLDEALLALDPPGMVGG